MLLTEAPLNPRRNREKSAEVSTKIKKLFSLRITFNLNYSTAKMVVFFTDVPFLVVVHKGGWEQGWCCGENACLPPMCPRFDSLTRRHMWVKFVFGLFLNS